ncbi:MFS general substrate transporter [Dacryopinax primogenitus]|uniref:MFS general substrate transporter n=1 Tax=Dacryopinax primogenitus (strain DJM 731) TaxID=1858805 RepID=M5FXN5_DACPD|nr:MFS general substrate transporter [Dacryopinax primogenitus]EJU00550.1 MFS general substrate transporter [Dacryopinax primogenitus]
MAIDDQVASDERTPLLLDGDHPLPKLQIFLLCWGAIVEPIAFFSIFPFINQMIFETGGVDEASVGFLSGVIESIFSLTQTVFMLLWGRAADRYGRKPVLVISLAGVTVASTFFGFSQTVWQMIVLRSVAGVFAGITVTVRTMISENSTPKNQARAFSFFAFATNLGIFVGPLIGGALSKPCTQYPTVFGNFALFEQYPYLLPCIAAGAMSGVGALLSVLFLKETRPIRDGKTHDHATIIQPPRIKEILAAPGVIPVIIIYQYALLLGIAFTAVAPIFFYTPIPLGGFGYSPPQISLFLAGCGISQAVWLLVAFPIFQRKWGTGNLLRACAWAWPISFSLFPLLSALIRNGQETLYWTLVPVAVVGPSGVSMAFTAVQLALNDIAPSHLALGTLNGLALSLMSAVRAVTPATFASIFAFGIKHQILAGYLAWAVMIVTAVGFIVVLRWLPEKAEGRPILKKPLDEQDA